MRPIKPEGRIVNSSRNFVYGLFSQTVTLLLNFLVRTFFIKYLNIEYLGVNGLFSNILTVLSLAELGFGSAMIYSMYNPLATNDIPKLQALMNLYKKVYGIIGIIVAVLGVSIVPFLDKLITNTSDVEHVEHLNIIYLLFLINSVSSYYFAYKRSILNADQKAYICSAFRFLFIVIRSILQILSLILFSNFILFLSIQIIATIIENISISIYVDRRYPYLKGKNNEVLTKEEIARIRKDVYALILSRISYTAINGTSNIIITAVAGLVWVGLYSNYTIITGAVIMIFSQIADAVRGSIGNYIAKEDPSTHYLLFRRIDFMYFWLYGFATIAMFVMFNPFITLWLGSEYILNTACVAVISINFMLEGFLNSLWTFRTTMGLFTQGKYRPVISAILNITIAISLGYKLGILGVLLGTTASRLLVNAWFDPYIIYKYGFGRTVWSYLKDYMIRLTVMCIAVGIIIALKQLFYTEQAQWRDFILLIAIIIIVTNLIFYIAYRRCKEFIYFLELAKSVRSQIIL